MPTTRTVQVAGIVLAIGSILAAGAMFALISVGTLIATRAAAASSWYSVWTFYADVATANLLFDPFKYIGFLLAWGPLYSAAFWGMVAWVATEDD